MSWGSIMGGLGGMMGGMGGGGMGGGMGGGGGGFSWGGALQGLGQGMQKYSSDRAGGGYAGRPAQAPQTNANTQGALDKWLESKIMEQLKNYQGPNPTAGVQSKATGEIYGENPMFRGI